MKVLSIRELTTTLVCPMCRGGPLREVTSGAECTRCGVSYGVDRVLSFLVPEQLSDTNKNEIKANTFEGDWVARILEKEHWHPFLTHQMHRAIEQVCRMLPASRELFVLGAGTGFDLSLLLRHRSYDRVFASDISPAATELIARSLAAFDGELGLFASEFLRCPIPKMPGRVGFVFQALHHAPDAHAALETLLDHSFDELVIVEPITNPPLGVLARFDLAQRVEYSGTRPDWLNLGRVKRLASARGYAVASHTWWEIPPYIMRPWLKEHPDVSRTFCRVVDAVSRMTGVIRFGSQAAIHLRRELYRSRPCRNLYTTSTCATATASSGS